MTYGENPQKIVNIVKGQKNELKDWYQNILSTIPGLIQTNGNFDVFFLFFFFFFFLFFSFLLDLTKNSMSFFQINK